VTETTDPVHEFSKVRALPPRQRLHALGLLLVSASKPKTSEDARNLLMAGVFALLAEMIGFERASSALAKWRST